MADGLDFSEEEIRQQLATLGYRNVPPHRLQQLKRDLDDLVRKKKLRSFVSSEELDSSGSRTDVSLPSPPAYTKEKVDPFRLAGPGDGFFLRSDGADQERQVFACCENRDHHRDFDVAPKGLPPSAVPTWQGVGPDQIQSPGGTPPRRHLIKRKVLRRHKGQSFVSNESLQSEDSGAASGLEEGLCRLHVTDTENKEASLQSYGASSDSGLSTTAFESFLGGTVEGRGRQELRPRAKAFIRPPLDHPHTRNLKKNDPVSRYFQYKHNWEVFKVPGERDRRALQLEIREQLAYQPPPPRQRRVLAPNTYVVPTEKKRSALRWEIRNNLALGVLPPKHNYWL